MSAALKWFKSSYSTEEPGEVCVEVAAEATAVHIRDSKVPDGPTFTVTPATWRAFVATARTAAN
ncbi:DUF397 domain-containing protein [Streptomyces sp. NPDC094448]|uniref:DUF397 domain-containing protein n=1 Tax=Streptomyces sp. NPDC094448 TaxID=3366063 RepID=UPI00382D9C54